MLRTAKPQTIKSCHTFLHTSSYYSNKPTFYSDYGLDFFKPPSTSSIHFLNNLVAGYIIRPYASW